MIDERNKTRWETDAAFGRSASYIAQAALPVTGWKDVPTGHATQAATRIWNLVRKRGKRKRKSNCSLKREIIPRKTTSYDKKLKSCVMMKHLPCLVVIISPTVQLRV